MSRSVQDHSLSSHGLIIIALLLLTFCSCYGHISSGYDVGAPSDGDADADSDADSDSDSDGDVEIDPTIEGVVEAIDHNASLRCQCIDETSGYDTTDECIDDITTSREVILCFQRAYQAQEDVLEEYYVCRFITEENYGFCLETAICDLDPSIVCYETYLEELEICPEISAEVGAAFDDIFVPCVAGEPSGCPDDTLAAGVMGFVENSANAGQDLTGSCGGRNAPDVAVRWTASVDGEHIIDVIEADFDTVLYVLESCDGEELACNDDIERASGNRLSRVEVTLESGQEIIIVVDSWAPGDFGAFEVEIRLPEAD